MSFEQPPRNENPIQTEAIQSNERKSKKKRNVIIASAAGLALAASAVVGGTVAANIMRPAPVAEAPADPTQEQEPTPTETAETPETPAVPELVTNYEELDWVQFNSMPQSERLAYIDYRLEEGAEEHAELLDSRDRPEYTEPSIDSTPQEILDNYVYINDQANYQSVIDLNTNEKIHDPNEAIKYLSGVFYDVNTDYLSNEYRSLLDEHLASAADSPYVTNTVYTATGSSEIQTGVRNDEEVQYMDISYYNQEGIDMNVRFIYTEYSSVDGTPQSTWLVDEFFTDEEPLPEY